MPNLWRLLKLVDSLSWLPRIGWVNAGVRDPETVAEHTLLVSYIAIELAKAMNLNPGKASLMALLHDAAESELGNASRFVRDSLGMDKWRMLEMSVVSKLGFGEEFSSLINQSEPEALVVAISDKLATLMRACLYAEQGYDTVELVKHYMGEVKELLGKVGDGRLSDAVNEVLVKCSDVIKVNHQFKQAP